MTDRFRAGIQVDDKTAPDWLKAALQASGASADFLDRCQGAASVAFDIVQLRRQGEQVRPNNTSFYEYLLALARPLGVSLDGIAASLGLDSLARLPTDTVRPLIKLGQQLGLSLGEIKRLLRHSLAIEVSPLPMHRPIEVDSVHPDAEWEERLLHLEASYSLTTRERLRAIELEVGLAFTDGRL